MGGNEFDFTDAQTALFQSTQDGSDAAGTDQDWADIEERVKAALVSGYISRLDSAGRDRVQTGHYDARDVAWSIIHALIHHATPGEPANREYLQEFLTPRLSGADELHGIRPNPDLHAAIINHVLAHLTNEKNNHAPIKETYTEHRAGKSTRKTVEFRVIEEVFQRSSNKPTFEVKAEFINIYLHSFGLDLEDEQVAQSAVLEAQIRRGRLADAQDQARRARITSETYRRLFQRRIEETRRSIEGVDWQNELPEELKRAEEHSTAQLAHHNSLIQLLHEKTERLDAEPRDVRVEIDGIEKEINRSIIAHMGLQADVQEARQTFFEEHDRQRFIPLPHDPKPHLTRDVLLPLLTLPSHEAEDILTSMTTVFGGHELPDVPTLVTDIPYMLRPKREHEPHRAFIEAEETAEADQDPLRLPLHKREALEEYLRVTQRTSLEEILNRAHADGLDSAELELLARIAMEAIDGVEKKLAHVIELGAPSFRVAALLFDEGGVYVMPRQGDAK